MQTVHNDHAIPEQALMSMRFPLSASTPAAKDATVNGSVKAMVAKKPYSAEPKPRATLMARSGVAAGPKSTR